MKQDVPSLPRRLSEAVHTVFVGKEGAVHTLILGLITGLHVLIEDIPGVGKTTLAKTLARCAGLDFGRVQFTPDLLPGDILGTSVWEPTKREFVFKSGAIMHQFLLADEVNRASARTQSAMLEAMQESAVTVDDRTHPLPRPFFVAATQNPSGFAGTFSLPEAQLDRFGLSFSISYPQESDENRILERFQKDDPFSALTPVAGPEDIGMCRDSIRCVRVDERIRDYLVRIAGATRKNKEIRLGMSPRATQHLLLAAQGEAFFFGREFVIPEDVSAVAGAVLQHRILLTSQARMDKKSPSEVIQNLLDKTEKPAGV